MIQLASVRRRLQMPIVLALCWVIGLAGAATADDVHLVNGSVFEGVVAHVDAEHVTVELAFGRMKLPRNQVLRVVEGESPLESFRERREALLSDSSSPAEDWLELAKWARANGLDRDARETALLVARLAPDLEGLAPVLRGLGYELDAELGWISFAEAMRRKGLVQYQGEWMEPVERRELVALRREELASIQEAGSLRQVAASENAVSENAVALEAIRLARDVVDGSNAARSNLGSHLGSGGFFAVGTVAGVRGPIVIPRLPLSGSFGGEVRPTGSTEEATSSSSLQRDWDILATRQPGSIIPMKSYRRQVRSRR